MLVIITITNDNDVINNNNDSTHKRTKLRHRSQMSAAQVTLLTPIVPLPAGKCWTLPRRHFKNKGVCVCIEGGGVG